MEDMNRESGRGLPRCLNKSSINNKPFTLMSLTTHRSHEDTLKKPFKMNHGGSSSSRALPPFDNDNLKIDNPPPRFQQNPNTDVAEFVAANGRTSVETDQQAIDFESKLGRKIDHDMDPRKLRRIISNRVSAQKSRIKKLQYVIDMEKTVKDLQAEIAVLSPRVSYEQQHNKLLQLENDVLQQKLNNFIERSKIAHALMEELKAEKNMLKELHMIQQVQQKQEEARMFGSNSTAIFENMSNQWAHMNTKRD